MVFMILVFAMIIALSVFALVMAENENKTRQIRDLHKPRTIGFAAA